jgi:hypothetical protein
MNLLTWAQRTLRVVETDGQTVARVRLTGSDGSIWHTWDAPLPAPDAWADEAEALLAELARELPPRRTSVTFAAEDRTGAIVSQCPRTIAGSNRAAGEAVSEQRALADAMASIVRTCEATLASANTQIATLTRTVEALGQRHSDALDLIGALQEQRTLQAQQAAAGETGAMLQQAMAELPKMLEMLGAAKTKASLARRPNGKVTTNDHDSTGPVGAADHK